MTLSQLDHPNLIVVHYWPYQGGKFFANCLAHHPAVMPQLAIDDSHQQLQAKKISKIHASLPPKDQITQWTRYELGCRSFWGGNLHDFFNHRAEVSDKALSMLQQYRCFIMSHVADPVYVDRLKHQLPQAKHIVLVNADNFTKLAVTLKAPGQDVTAWLERNRLQPDRYLRFPATSFADNELFRLDVDTVYYQQTLIRPAVEQCLYWLGLDNKLDPAVDQFIERYLRLHDLL